MLSKKNIYIYIVKHLALDIWPTGKETRETSSPIWVLEDSPWYSHRSVLLDCVCLFSFLSLYLSLFLYFSVSLAPWGYPMHGYTSSFVASLDLIKQVPQCRSSAWPNRRGSRSPEKHHGLIAAEEILHQNSILPFCAFSQLQDSGDLLHRNSRSSSAALALPVLVSQSYQLDINTYIDIYIYTILLVFSNYSPLLIKLMKWWLDHAFDHRLDSQSTTGLLAFPHFLTCLYHNIGCLSNQQLSACSLECATWSSETKKDLTPPCFTNHPAWFLQLGTAVPIVNSQMLLLLGKSPAATCWRSPWVPWPSANPRSFPRMGWPWNPVSLKPSEPLEQQVSPVVWRHKLIYNK